MFTTTSKGSVDVKLIQEKDFNILDENYNQPSTFYIVDPGKTKDNCNPPDFFQGQVIIVASPDEGHWGGEESIAVVLFYQYSSLHRLEFVGIVVFQPIYEIQSHR